MPPLPEMEVNMNRFKRFLPFLAVFSIAAYSCAIMVQLGYYSEYRIDMFILTPRVDPTSLLTIIVVIIFTILAIAQFKLMNYLRRSERFVPALITDFVIFLTLTYSFLKPSVLQFEWIDINFNLNLLYGAVLVAIYSVRIKAAVDIYRKNPKNWHQIYIATSFWRIGGRVGKNANSKMTIHWSGVVLIALITTIAVPYAVGSSFALARTEYVELVTSVRTDTTQIVIGQSSDGYVIKGYDEREKKFNDAWAIVKKDNLEFRSKSIVSLEEQK